LAGIYNTVNEDKFFKLPDMGDYYDEDLMEEYMKTVDSAAPKDAAFYIEEPFSTELGYHEDYEVFVLKADAIIAKNDSAHNTDKGKKYEELNIIDGDTIRYYVDSIKDGGNSFTINDVTYKSFKDYYYNLVTPEAFLNNALIIRSVGINAPEVSHRELTGLLPEKIKTNVKSFPKSEFENNSDFIYEINKTRDKDNYDFIKIKNSWYEIVETYDANPYPLSSDDEEKINSKSITNQGGKFYAYVALDDQLTSNVLNGVNTGEQASKMVRDLLNKATDMRLLVDAKEISNTTNYSAIYKVLQEGWDNDVTLYDLFEAAWQVSFNQSYKYGGLPSPGKDFYGRFLGALYLKIDSDWINVNKYLLSKISQVKLMPGLSPQSQANNNNLSDAFKVWSYDNSKSVIADGFYDISKSDYDDRMDIQKTITGLDFSTFREYTVMIGDCLFMVPPTSIRVVNQIQNEKVPVLRSKSSMIKERPHNDRLIEITLYFNADEGINGVEIQKQLPKQNGTDEHETYYMNGLRTLIAMFKYTPFLPIENKYLNDTLGIEAVALANLQIETLPSFPNCLAATLTLQQFNYRVYMNELPLPDPDKGENFNTNIFARTINYGVMRYYYQRAIQNGEDIKSIDSTSQEFVEKTMGHKTSLVPMEFKDPKISFMIMDENWLDEMLQIKLLASKQPLQQTDPINDKTEKWAQQVGNSFINIIAEGKKIDGDVTSATNQFITDCITNGSCPYLIDVKYTGKNGDKGIYKFTFNVNLLTTEELKNLINAISKNLSLKTQNIFSDGTIELELSSDGWNTGTDQYQVANFFAYRSTDHGDDINNEDWANFSTVSNSAFYQNIKDYGIDTESMLSAKFVKYPIEDILAQQFSISMGNALSNTSLKAQDGFAPQYAGGQDTIVEFTFYTQNSEAVTALNAMQDKAASQLMKYKQIISAWPIRINSELTKLCSIYEVIIESIDISTVPNQPGLYAIQCRAVSVDRTVRNKEALQKLDAINNSGATNATATASYVYRNYFELNNVLSKAEVYPDLELPTLDELDSTGYKFIRYMKKGSSRTYPDPDFYFIYGYAYSSKILRKIIVDYFSKGTNSDTNSNDDNSDIPVTNFITTFYSQNHPQSYDTQYNHEKTQEVLTYTANNADDKSAYDAALKEQRNLIQTVRKKAGKESNSDSKNSQATDNLYNKTIEYENELMSMGIYSWDVCEKIKCTLPEDITTKADGSEDTDIEEELKTNGDKIIEIIDDILNSPIDTSNCTKINLTIQIDTDELEKSLKKFSSANSDWSKILSAFGVASPSTDALDCISKIYESAAIALSGNAEYTTDADPSTYMPRMSLHNPKMYGVATVPGMTDELEYFPYCKISDKNTGEVFCATTKEKAIEDGLAFGPFQTQKYDVDFLKDFYNTSSTAFDEKDFLDPYYNKALHKDKFEEDIDQTEYKTMLIESPDFCVMAFHRNVLAWVKKLIQNQNYLSYFDLRRDDIKSDLSEMLKEVLNTNEGKDTNSNLPYYKDYSSSSTAVAGPMNSGLVEQNQTQTESNEETTEATQEVKDYARAIEGIVDGYDDCMVLGKIFLPTICMVISGDKTIYGKIEDKDIGTLNVKTRNCQSPVSVSDDISDGERLFRKMIRGLASPQVGIITNISGIAGEGKTKLEEAMMERNEKLWCSASEDASKWVLHSFYDMVTNDKRGRMARAFPTYYMLLIDEGRKIGYWRLHDNFYNMNSITEIEVVKSRKMPADTARIVMTNLFKTFSTDDEDVKTDYSHNLIDVWNSIFSPNTYFDTEEAKRMRQMNINRATIQPGIRIHLRMGYSGNAAELPILFNGVVAEATTGELVEITAQSDGHEISNSQAFAATVASDASELANESYPLKWFFNFFNTGDTPKSLIRNIFTTKSGFIGKMVNKFTNGRFFNDNMFGITHFGEIDFKKIHNDGEIMQNIYEAEGRLPWDEDSQPGTLAEQYATDEVPYFTIELKDKSVWDILNICASSSLEFICGVAPFGIRSTMFMGRPHYYYAYDYEFADNGLITEKRKPFQQYHIIDSYSDIIGNNIIATGKDIKTVAIPTWKGPNFYNSIVERKGVPMYADWDIYPEFQKTMTVNTGITYKGSKAGFLFYNKYNDLWSKEGGQKIAWRIGANTLKESFKDMYQGEVIIIGDTSIKPRDKVFMHDVYENIDGPMEVEAVVQSLTPETGFTSSVFADCISTSDSRYEQIGQMWTKHIVTQIVAVKSAMFASHKLFGTSTKPMLNVLAQSINKGAYKTGSLINTAANLAGKDDIIKYSSLNNWSDTFYKALNLSSDDIAIWTKLDALTKWKDVLNSLKAIEGATSKEIISLLKDVINASNSVTPEELANTLNSAVEKGTIKSTQVEDIKKTISALKNMDYSNSDLIDCVNSIIDESVKSLDGVENLSSDAQKALNILKAGKVTDTESLSKALNALDEVSDVVNLDSKADLELLKTSVSGAETTIKAVDDAVSAAKVTTSVTSTLTTAGVVTGCLVEAAEAAVLYVLTKNIYNYIENTMASFNVLTVYPLNKNGYPMVGGIDGHEGLVFGSPTWNTPGVIDNIINWAFEDGSWGYNLFKDIVFTDEMKKIAETYKKTNGLGDYADTANTYQSATNNLLKAISESEASNYSTYKSMIFQKRLNVTNSKSDEAKYTYNKTRISSDADTNDITTNSVILNELIPITVENSTLAPYFGKGTLKIAHEMNVDSSSNIKRATYKFENVAATKGSVITQGIFLTDDTIDIPFLRPDAYQLFKRILELVAKKATAKGYGDNQKLITYLKSGTVVNSKSWASTGYSFRIQIANLTDDEVEGILNDAAKELKSLFTDSGASNAPDMFQYKNIGSNVFEIFVAPRDEYYKLNN
jgi:hypothetical protein